MLDDREYLTSPSIEARKSFECNLCGEEILAWIIHKLIPQIAKAGSDHQYPKGAKKESEILFNIHKLELKNNVNL